jgi:hypothetical protein
MRRVTSKRILAFAALAPLATEPDDGCLTAFDGSAPVESSTRAAHELWIRDCADCHGIAGAADGQRSAALDPRPPDFTSPCRPVQDAWVARVILEGGASFGGNDAMRAHHELEASPEVLKALVDLVQGFRASGPCVREPRTPDVAPQERD